MAALGQGKPVFEAQVVECEHDLRACSLERSTVRVPASLQESACACD